MSTTPLGYVLSDSDQGQTTTKCQNNRQMQPASINCHKTGVYKVCHNQKNSDTFLDSVAQQN